jgi:hypothetical protein
MQRVVVIAAAILFAPVACAAGEKAIRLAIAPGKAGEVCMPLASGDTLAWHFKASAPTDFNLHQHVGADVLMPVDRKGVREDRARHTVDRSNDWCLMWTAPAGQRVTVSGGWQAMKALARP